MESLYATKWSIDIANSNNATITDIIARILSEASRATNINAESKKDIIDLARKALRKCTDLSVIFNALSGEIELAKKRYDVEHPTHPNRYFSFDEKGEMHSITEEEFVKIAPDIPLTGEVDDDDDVIDYPSGTTVVPEEEEE